MAWPPAAWGPAPTPIPGGAGQASRALARGPQDAMQLSEEGLAGAREPSCRPRPTRKLHRFVPGWNFPQVENCLLGQEGYLGSGHSGHRSLGQQSSGLEDMRGA